MYDELAWTLHGIGIMSVLSPKDVSPSRVELLAEIAFNLFQKWKRPIELSAEFFKGS
jgi:hypothetical protein